MNPDALQRYARQILLKEVGGPGQNALMSAKVLIVGAGGLGGPAGLYLAAGGVGTLGLVDDDNVALSNLHRQIQFGTAQLGQPKTGSMIETLHGINPDVRAQCHPQRLDSGNANAILDDYDIVLDGTDNFKTRFAINQACLQTGKQLISGALGRFDGQLAVFKNDGKQPCYRCLVPEIPPEAETCAAVGVLGPLAGIIGAMMALEAMKIITGAGTPLYGKLFLYDGLSGKTRRIKILRDSGCKACAS